MIKHKSLIDIVVSKNDTDLLIKIASHRDGSYNQFTYVQVYIYNPKLYYRESKSNNENVVKVLSNETIVKILSTDLGLTKDEIRILLNTPCKCILEETDKIAKIRWYDLWKARHELLQTLKTKKTTDLDATKLKMIAGQLPAECNYKTYKNLPDTEKQLYKIKDLISIDNLEKQTSPFGAYLDDLDKAKNILAILYNHNDIVKKLKCDIKLNNSSDETSIKLSKNITDNTLYINEIIIQNEKKYYCNYIPFDKLCDEFKDMFKNINSSIYMTKVIPYKEALDIMNEQYIKVYMHELDISKKDDVLKDIAGRYLKTIENNKRADIVSSDIILSEIETEIIHRPECIKNTRPAIDGYNTTVEYVTNDPPTFYVDKEVSNKDLLYLLKEIISGLDLGIL